MQDELDNFKKKIQTYALEGIGFCEPHFSWQMSLRAGNKKQVIDHLLDPKSLIFVEQRTGKYGDFVYSLHFLLEDKKTLILPVIFKPTKGLYVITYILRERLSRGI